MIKVDGISFSYSDKTVLNNISFSVEDGDVFAILGPNGAGKTTLMRVLSGRNPLQFGSVSIDNDTISSRFPEKAKSRIGVMREISGIYLKMTGYEYLCFVGALYNLPEESIHNTVISLAKKYKFYDELDRQIKKYSTGTRKKVEFCAATINNAKHLLLDEPFESVDPQICFEIKSCIRDYVRDKKASVLMCSHILDTVQNLCNKYVIIYNGYIVGSGTIEKEMSPSLEEIYLSVVGDQS